MKLNYLRYTLTRLKILKQHGSAKKWDALYFLNELIGFFNFYLFNKHFFVLLLTKLFVKFDRVLPKYYLF